MPRPRRQSRPLRLIDGEKPNSLIASAALLTQNAAGSAYARPKEGVAEWQTQGWYFYDTIGEFRYGVSWRANACSRARLTVTEPGPDGSDVQVTEGPEVEALNALFGGDAGQSEMLGAVSLHLDVPGETYIVGEVEAVPDPITGEQVEVDRWAIYSNEELTKPSKNAPWEIDRGDGRKRRLNPDTSVVIRLWKPHPRKWVEANSATRAVLPVLRELENLTQAVGAALDSRLAGAGVFVVPSEATFGGPPTDPASLSAASPDAMPDDAFLVKLTEAMMTSMADRTSAARVVPIVLRVPGAFLKGVQHITFSTPLDERSMELRTECIRRLALGIDLPPEVLLGLSDSNHWSAWQIEESALKVHVEPHLETITAGLTERWLQPAVQALGATVNPNRRINYNVDDLRMRPDRSAQAIDLFDRIELSGEALLRETGFDSGDAPDDDERALLIARKMALGGTLAPEQVTALLRTLGVENLPDAPTQPPPVAPSPAEAPPAEEPTTPEPPQNSRDIPAQEAVAARGLIAAADQMACRAIERGWNKVGNRSQTRRPVAADRLDEALRGAWDHAPRVAAMLAVDPAWLTGCLDTYTRSVLTEGTPHSPEVLARVLGLTLG